MATLAGIKGSVATLLRATTGVHKVDTKPGGQLPWALKAKPKQSFWWVHIPKRLSSERGVPLGGTRDRFVTVRCEGWMPRSYTNPDSTPTWDALLDAVCDKLEANRSLSATVNDMGLPSILMNDFQPLGDENTPEVLCHHAIVEVVVNDYGTYTTT